MAKIRCAACGCEVESKILEKHLIVPTEITENAGLETSKTVRLCPKCSEEIQRWYKTNITDVTYDTKLKRFGGRSPIQMVQEYEKTYRRFTRYKKGQQRLL